MAKNDVKEPELGAETAAEPEIIIEDAKSPVIAAEDGIEELRKQLAAEKTRRELAERERTEAQTQVFKAKAEVEDTNLHLINNAIQAVKSNSASLKSDYAKAMAAGNYDRAADVQMEMSSNQAKLLQLESGKQAMAERPKQAAPVADPVEALARQLTPRSAAWVRAHPECATDQRLYNKMLAAHNMTQADGIQPDSAAYFDAVEHYLGYKGAPPRDDEDDGTDVAAKVVQRRVSPASAPVSRSGTSTSTTPRSVRLSEEEREAARLSKMTEREYYEAKMRGSSRRTVN